MFNAKIRTGLLVATLAVGQAACTSKPILNITDAPVTTSTGKAAQSAQVRTAIVNAGTSLGWVMVETSPGVMQGTLSLRSHTAVVEIPYSATKYSIRFKSGTNLNERDGEIHKNYNGWIQNLDGKIRSEISRL
jgi:hypothetical protein